MRCDINCAGKGVVSLFAAIVSCLPVSAVPKSVPPSRAQVVKLVRQANVLPPDAEINADLLGKEIVVSTYLNPKANDNDCKIDAVLMAKQIFDAYSSAVNDVRVNFFETNDSARATYRCVIVRAGDVAVLAKGVVSKEALLASITVAHEKRTPVPTRPPAESILSLPIKSGFKMRERQTLLNDIRELQAKNQEIGSYVADVRKCCEMFSKSEGELAKGDQQNFIRSFNDMVIVVNQEQAKINRVVTALYSKNPSKGPQYERRVAIFQRLALLEKQGKDVTQLRRIFEKDIEPRAKSGEDSLELEVSLTTVERALSKL